MPFKNKKHSKINFWGHNSALGTTTFEKLLVFLLNK